MEWRVDCHFISSLEPLRALITYLQVVIQENLHSVWVYEHANLFPIHFPSSTAYRFISIVSNSF